MKSSSCNLILPCLLVVALAGCAVFPPLDDADTESVRDPDSTATASREAADSGRSRAEENPTVGDDRDQAPQRTVLAALASDKTYTAADLAEDRAGDRVLARVAGEEIRCSDLFEVYFMDNPIKARRVVQDLALYTVVRKEATRLGITVDAEEVGSRLDAMIRDQQGRIAMGIDETLGLDEFVRTQYGLEMPAYRDLIRRSALFQALLERCIRYKELTVRRLQVGAILFRDAITAERIFKKLKKGASFDVIAREQSGESDGPQGGILPPLPADMDYPVIKDGMTLGLGEISEVMETRVGKEKFYRIIKLVEILEPLNGSYEELREQVEESLKAEPLVIPDLVDYWMNSVSDRYALEMTMY